MRTRLFCVLLLASALAADELLDRIAVVVGQDVITETEVLREARLAAFLNEEPLDLSGPAKRRAAERLVEQQLIRADMQTRPSPQPDPAAVEKALKEVQSRYRDPAEYLRALKEYGLTESDLKAHLAWQLAALRFTDARFLPAGGNGPPDSSDMAHGIDERLDGWLKEARSRVRVEFREEVFR